MVTDIYQYLQEIAEGRYGVDIRIPIYNALAILADSDAETITRAAAGYPVSSPIASEYDISEELDTISTSTSGAEVKDAIHDALEKLSQLTEASMTVISGLASIDMSQPSRPAANDHYISGITGSTVGDTDFEGLAEFLMASGLFSNVVYDEVEELYKGIAVYVNGKVLAELNYMLGTEGWLYTFTVHTDGENADNTLFYPSDEEDPLTVYSMMPKAALRTKDAAVITCEGNAILFSRNSKGGVSVSFGHDAEKISIVTDVKRRIRTFTRSSTISSYGGIGHSHINSNVGSLTALVSEGDNAVNVKSYALTLGNLTGIDGVVSLGTRRIYIANDMFAIEI